MIDNKKRQKSDMLRPKRLFLQPWWVQMMTSACTAFPICIATSIVLPRHSGSGWLHLFETLWPFVLAQPIIFFLIRHWANERFYSRKLPLRRSQGISLKICAVILCVLAMLTGILASENPASSVWAPGGELWLVILMIVLLWTLAAFSFLTGDAIIQFSKEGKGGLSPSVIEGHSKSTSVDE